MCDFSSGHLKKTPADVYVTYTRLKALGACPEGIEWFSQAFPPCIAACSNKDWIHWALTKWESL